MRVFAGLIIVLLGACGLVKSDKRPKYSGPVQKPYWQVDGVMVDQVFISNRIVFCRARTIASPERRLYAFSGENGSRLWIADFEPADGLNHFFSGDLLLLRTSDKRTVVLD